MKAVPFGELEPAEWDAVAEASDEAWLFHRAAWIGFEEAQAGFANLSFGLVSGGTLTALAPFYRSALGLGTLVETLVHDGLHRHTGLACAPQLTPDERRGAEAAWMNEIFEIARREDADRIHLARQNLSPAWLSPSREEIPAWVMKHRFQLGQAYGPGGLVPAPGLSTVAADQIVVLGGTEEEQFARLKDTCRRAVRKAGKAGARAVVMTQRDRCVDSYYELARRSAERTGEQLAPVGFYRAIHAAFAPAGRCTILAVEVDGAPAAAAFLLHDKRAMHFLSGVSDPSFLDRRVNDFLHWSAIREARERGCSHYRLGPYFPAVPRGWPVETVSRFKTKFGADSRTIVQGSLFLKPGRYVELAQQHVAQLCKDLAG